MPHVRDGAQDDGQLNMPQRIYCGQAVSLTAEQQHRQLSSLAHCMSRKRMRLGIPYWLLAGQSSSSE